MDFDWQRLSWRRDETGGESDARIMVTSDWAPIRAGGPLILADPEGVYGRLLPELRRADLRIVNLECALGDAGTPIYKAGPNLEGGPDAIGGLTAPGFHVACLGNNHTFDFGPERFRQMTDLLAQHSIRTVGAGLSETAAWQPLVATAGDARIGIVNFCEGEDLTAAQGDAPGVCGWDVERAIANVRELRGRADVVLVICHAGREHTPLPPPYVVAAYRRIAEAGADAIVAHHPHVPQGIEVHRGVPIVYSMGNFLFYERGERFYQKVGYMTELGLSGRRLSGLRLIPYRQTAEGLTLIKGELLTWLAGRLRRVSELLADDGAVRDAWHAFIEVRSEAGFEALLAWALKSFEDNPPLGAARVRNLFVTQAHRHLWTDGLTRIVEGAWGTAPAWACDLVREWTTLTVEQGLACPA